MTAMAELMSVIAITGCSLEKFATEVRGLQKTELREVEEPFRAGQKGSSAMPHKRNPINCEKICGLSRVLRGYAMAAMEDVALWHERDISHSSVERIILPDATELLDYMLSLMTRILGDLFVYPENMLRSMSMSYGLPNSQHVLLTLIDKGMLRETAYDCVQRCACARGRSRSPSAICWSRMRRSRAISPRWSWTSALSLPTITSMWMRFSSASASKSNDSFDKHQQNHPRKDTVLG